VPRIDLDGRGGLAQQHRGHNRRNEAIALTEAWATAHHRSIQFSYTLPTFETGLTAPGLAVLQNAVADHARVSVVNIMTFDYYYCYRAGDGDGHRDAGAGLVSQLQTLYPGASPARLWHMVGVTEMPGIDDFGPDETFTQADAVTVLHWAQSKGIALLSFWALQTRQRRLPGHQGRGSTAPDWPSRPGTSATPFERFHPLIRWAFACPSRGPGSTVPASTVAAWGQPR